MKNKKKLKMTWSPVTIMVIVISVLVLIIGSLAIGILPSLLIVLVLDIVYFKNEIMDLWKAFQKKRKHLEKKKTTTKKLVKDSSPKRMVSQPEKIIHEYKKGDKIISTRDDDMKKKKTKTKKTTAKEKRKKGKRHIGMTIFQCLIIFFSICFMAGVAAVIVFCTYIVTHAPEFNAANLYSTEPSKLYWADGSLMATIGSENRIIVTYDEIPEVFINALVATEDANFFQHNGIDLKRFLVASVQQLMGNSDAGGASTLTMQLSKNTYTSTEAHGWDGIIRKFTDVYLSVFKIEPTYTKEEILEFYANTNQLGSAYGIEAASELYFGKKAKDMNISEAALLAGMFQAPSGYNPTTHPEAAEKRRINVLKLLLRHSYITEEEYAIAEKMTVDKIVKTDGTVRNTQDEIEDEARSAVDVVVKEVIERTGQDPRLVSMEIYTTFNKEFQIHIGKIMSGETYEWEHEKSQAGVAVVNIKNGAIVAVGGNRNTKVDNAYNHATELHKQIGSTAKPLYDYGPAIEYLNWSTGTVIADEPMTYSDGSKIGNWDSKYAGFKSIRSQLSASRNIPALKTFQKLDKNQILTFVKNLGLHPEEYLHEAHSIGGYGDDKETGESPLSMAAAYAAFGNGGYYTAPYSVTKIVNSQTGEVTTVQSETKQVMSSATAYMITSILQDAAESGVAPKSKVNNVPYAGKTGTTNYSSEDIKKHKLPSKVAKDMWVATYNTEYAISVWYGFDSLKDGYNLMGTKPQRNLFVAVAKKIYTNKANFKMPDTVTKVKIEKDSATLMLPSEFTPSKYITEELFVAGTEPSLVSTRFSKLNDVTNLTAVTTGNTITLSWNPIATPDPFNKTLLKQQNKSAYISNSKLDEYVNTLYKKNVDELGSVGYNVYVQTSDGLTLLGWTPNTTYTVTGQTGNVTLVVKTCYSKFKKNLSDGVSVSATVTGTTPPVEPDTPTNPDTPIEGETI